jgi:hypothetical protein
MSAKQAFDMPKKKPAQAGFFYITKQPVALIYKAQEAI